MKGFLGFAYQYSVRNLLRNKRRTFLTLLTVGATVALTMVASRYAAALFDLWIDGAVDTGTAHAQFHVKGYWDRQEGVDPELCLNEGNDIEKKLAEDPMVEAWVRRFRFEGLIANDQGSSFFLANAVDPEQELAVSPRMFNNGADEGKFLSKEKDSDATIGLGLSKLLKFKLGESATLIAQTGQGSVNAVDVDVVGVVDVPLPSFSKHALYLSLRQAQKVLRLPGVYNELAVRLKPGVELDDFLRKYEAFAAPLNIEVKGWWDVEPLISKVQSIWSAVSTMLCFLLLISTALTVVNVIFMTVNERVVEIGTLMAIGAKPYMVRVLFAVEGAVIGLFGGFLGLLGGAVCLTIMGSMGIPFESPFGSGVELIYPKVDWLWTGLALLASGVVCSVCSLPPARKAARVDPVVAFRNML